MRAARQARPLEARTNRAETGRGGGGTQGEGDEEDSFEILSSGAHLRPMLKAALKKSLSVKSEKICYTIWKKKHLKEHSAKQ